MYAFSQRGITYTVQRVFSHRKFSQKQDQLYYRKFWGVKFDGKQAINQLTLIRSCWHCTHQAQQAAYVEVHEK